MATSADIGRSPVGLIGSVLLHLGIIGATLFTFAHKLDIAQESPPVVPVDLVTIAAKTNLMPTVREHRRVQPKEEEPTPPEPQKSEAPPQPTEPPPEKRVAPPEPKPVEAPPPPPPPKAVISKSEIKPPPPPPLEEVTPKPEIKPPPPPKPPKPQEVKPKPETVTPESETKPDSSATTKVKPKPEPTKAEAKKNAFDINNVIALLDKRTPAEKSAPDAKVADRTLKGFGPQNAMTMELQDALRSQIQQCWNPPVGAPHPEEMVVQFELFLNQNGSVAQPPQLSAESQNAVARDSYTRAAAEAARRAIYTCAPYKLPADQYGQWQDITLNFDPRQMMGQ